MMDSTLIRLVSACALISAVVSARGVCAVESIRFEQDGPPQEVVGEALVESRDGGVLLQARDGQIWTLQPEQIKERTDQDGELEPMTQEEIGKELVREFGAGFEIYQTAHYVVVSNADERFAQYCSGLFEKLYRGFYAFWKNNGMDLEEPRFPLIALVFDRKASFHEYARREAGDAAESIIGYYNLKTNRITTYNVAEGARGGGDVFVIDRNIATLVHEATHQLAYNCGLQKRYADNPFWVSEGMAVFFESPDLNHRDGWRRIGRINEVNRLRFAQYLPQRPTDSIVTLVQDDTRLTNSAQATQAYSEAWALTYFLLKTRPKDYVAYLKTLSEGEHLKMLGPRERLDMFRQAFGDLEKLDQQFVAYVRRFVLRR